MDVRWILVVPLGLAIGCGGSPEEPAAVEQRPAGVEIVAGDFSFEVDTESIPAGEVATTLVNRGKEPHQAGFYRLNDGVQYEEFVTEILKDDSQIPQLAEGGGAGVMRPIYPGETYTRPGDDLVPGTYALLCSIRDPKTGKNHYELGMVSRIEVE